MIVCSNSDMLVLANKEVADDIISSLNQYLDQIKMQQQTNINLQCMRLQSTTCYFSLIESLNLDLDCLMFNLNWIMSSALQA